MFRGRLLQGTVSACASAGRLSPTRRLDPASLQHASKARNWLASLNTKGMVAKSSLNPGVVASKPLEPGVELQLASFWEHGVVASKPLGPGVVASKPLGPGAAARKLVGPE